MVTAWSQRGEDWHGLVEIGDRGGMGLGRWAVWVRWGCGVEIDGFSWLFDGVLLGLGAVCGFVSGSDGGSIEGFDGDFLKLVSWNMWGFGLV